MIFIRILQFNTVFTMLWAGILVTLCASAFMYLQNSLAIPCSHHCQFLVKRYLQVRNRAIFFFNPKLSCFLFVFLSCVGAF